MNEILLILCLIILLMYLYNKPKRHLFFGPIMKTNNELKKGLMFRKEKLKPDQGMLFIMNKNSNNSVWMKNTYLSLDVIFLNSDKQVVGYIENTQPLSKKSLSINKNSSYILETNSGTIQNKKINVNDIIHHIESDI